MNKQHANRSTTVDSVPDPSSPQERSTMTPSDKARLVALKAYELYERRGRTDGQDVDDWLEAEGIIDGTHS